MVFPISCFVAAVRDISFPKHIALQLVANFSSTVVIPDYYLSEIEHFDRQSANALTELCTKDVKNEIREHDITGDVQILKVCSTEQVLNLA